MRRVRVFRGFSILGTDEKSGLSSREKRWLKGNIVHKYTSHVTGHFFRCPFFSNAHCSASHVLLINPHFRDLHNFSCAISMTAPSGNFTTGSLLRCCHCSVPPYTVLLYAPIPSHPIPIISGGGTRKAISRCLPNVDVSHRISGHSSNIVGGRARGQEAPSQRR